MTDAVKIMTLISLLLILTPFNAFAEHEWRNSLYPFPVAYASGKYQRNTHDRNYRYDYWKKLQRKKREPYYYYHHSRPSTCSKPSALRPFSSSPPWGHAYGHQHGRW